MTETCKQKIPDWKQLWKSVGVSEDSTLLFCLLKPEVDTTLDWLHNPTDNGLQRSSLHEEFFTSTKRSFKILTQLRTNKAVKYQTRHSNNETVLDIFFKWSIFSLRALSPSASWQPRTCCAPVCSLRSAARQCLCPGSTNTQGGNQTSFWTGQVQHWKMWFIRLNVFAVTLFFLPGSSKV